MSQENFFKKRRVRYKGTHPSRFEEKYKELNPARYGADVKKVLERGQTPAGTHRPVCVGEILDILDPKPGMVGLDATLGFGGHAQEILHRIAPGGVLFGIDVDPVELPRTEARLRALGFSQQVLKVKRLNFAGMHQLLPEAGGGFDFIVADLGVSSMQIDTPLRGFSYKIDGPLDLRLNPNRGQPASEMLRSISETNLTDILIANADEPRAPEIAQAIYQNRDRISTTAQLADVVRRQLAVGGSGTAQEETRKSLQRTFQALRIHVNDEFAVLERFLELLPVCLKPAGRVAVLSFHSGEDRRVKKSFLEGFRAGIYKQIAAEPTRPSPEERRANPRSASAKLRWAIRR